MASATVAVSSGSRGTEMAQAGFHERCRATEPLREQRGRLDVIELLDGIVLDQPVVSISPSDSTGSTPSIGSEVKGASIPCSMAGRGRELLSGGFLRWRFVPSSMAGRRRNSNSFLRRPCALPRARAPPCAGTVVGTSSTAGAASRPLAAARTSLASAQAILAGASSIPGGRAARRRQGGERQHQRSSPHRMTCSRTCVAVVAARPRPQRRRWHLLARLHACGAAARLLAHPR